MTPVLPHRRELIFVKFTPHNTLLHTLLLYSRELTITIVNRTDRGEYQSVANNSEGNVTSNAATLDVQCEYTSCLFEYDMTSKTSGSVVTSGLLLYIGSLG